MNEQRHSSKGIAAQTAVALASSRHATSNSLAALTSSSRRTGVVTGASFIACGSFAASLQQLAHDLDEFVERFLALGFGRLDQQALRHQQREIIRRRVDAVIEQALGEIQRGHAVCFLLLARR